MVSAAEHRALCVLFRVEYLKFWGQEINALDFFKLGNLTSQKTSPNLYM